MHVFNLAGERIKSFKPHQASVSDIEMDSTADFVATASIDGEKLIIIRRLTDWPGIRAGRRALAVYDRILRL